MTRENLVRYLKNSGFPFEIIPHKPAYTAHEVASASHVSDKELAKTVVVRADGKYWMVILRGDQRLNERLLKQMLAANTVHLAHEEDLGHLFPGCDLGAMPPFGSLYGLPVIVEQALAEDEEIVFNACSHKESIRMKYRDYERLTQPLVGRLAVERGAYADWDIP
jgi:Ala-tRNA(Pro) deacylase